MLIFIFNETLLRIFFLFSLYRFHYFSFIFINFITFYLIFLFFSSFNFCVRLYQFADPIIWWACYLRVYRKYTPIGKPGRKCEMRNRHPVDSHWTVMAIFFSFVLKLFLCKSGHQRTVVIRDKYRLAQVYNYPLAAKFL